MDAAAYLTRQGWRGDGHSLDPKGRGIKKRLLMTRRQGPQGIGKKKNDPIGDQWWQGAFDGALKGLSVTTPGSSRPTTPPAPKDDPPLSPLNTKWSGLYTSFVRGSTMDGTIGPDLNGDPTAMNPGPSSSTGHGTAPQRKNSERTHVRFDEELEVPPQSPRTAKSKKKSKRRRSSSNKDEIILDSPQPPDSPVPDSPSLEKHPDSRRSRNSNRDHGHRGDTKGSKSKRNRKS